MKPKIALLETLHLVMLGGFALAQPLYQVLVNSPAFFVVRRSRGLDLWLLVGVLSLVLPLLVAALPPLVGLVNRRAGWLLHRVILTGWVAIGAMPVLKRSLALGDAGLIALAATVGLIFALIYSWQPAVRMFASFLLPAVVVFPTLFLLDPAIRRVLDPPQPRPVEEVAIARPAPVIVLVFDALPTTSLMDRQGQIDPVRYPALARLATTGTWYRKATAASDYTAYAVPAILTGSYSDLSLLPSLIDYPDNLFTLLGGSYRVRAWEPVTQLCPADVCGSGEVGLGERWKGLARDLSVVYRHQVLPPGMTEELPPVAQRWKDFADDAHQAGPERQLQKMADFESLLAALDPADPRSLYFLHLVWPHAPFQLLPDGRFYVDQQEQPTIDWPADPWPGVLAYQRHLLQLAFVDGLVGRLLDKLDSLGLYDQTLIAVTADHGVSFRPGEKRRRMTASNRADILPVPLIIKAPGQQSGGVDDRPASVVDLLPTLAEELGVELPFATDGRSLHQPPAESRILKTLGEALLEIPPAALDPSVDTLQRKLELFGDGAESQFPQTQAARGLIGQAARGLVVAGDDASKVSAAVEQPELYRQVALGSTFVPSLIGGWARLPAESSSVTLAVAIGGVVRAVTRTTARPGSGGLASWQAVVEPSAFRRGRNRIDLYLVTAKGQRLIPVSAGAGEDPFVGVRLGIEPFAGIDQHGFHKIEQIGGLPARWTRGQSVLRIPLSGNEKPHQVQVDLAQVAPQGSEVTILAEGVTLFAGRIEQGPWSQTFPLPPLRRPQLALQLRSDTFVPREALEGNKDSRVLGVALAGVWLLRDEEAKSEED